MRSRAVAIIIDRHAHSVLMIHRWKDGREYYVLPGGKIEDGETPQEACAREVQEETGLQIQVGQQVAVLHNLGRLETYFLAESFTGNLALGFPEKGWQTAQNVYQLEWVNDSRLPSIDLYPVQIHPHLAALLGAR